MDYIALAGAAFLSLLVYGLWPRRIHVTRVVDGDSIEATLHGHPIRCRLPSCDAPEYRQPGGHEARAALGALLQGQIVRLCAGGTDQYGRSLGHILVNGKPVAWKLIAAGHAWPSTRFGFILSVLPRLRRKGLWALASRHHPSDWRRINS